MATPAANLTGRVYGRLTALKRIENSKSNKARWLCLCACGVEKEVTAYHLKSSGVRSCGCLLKEPTHNTSHHMSKTKIYGVWSGIINRCYNAKEPAYKDYGGRGIQVCNRWRYSFETFYADMGNMPNKHPIDGRYSIDRIDNNGNYSLDNCRWATCKQQARNRRSTRYLTIDGESKPLVEWAEISGIAYATIRGRMNRGWSSHRAVFAEV